MYQMINQDNETRISGVIDSVTFRNAVNSFTVLEINCEGNLVCAVGQIGDCISGEEVTLTGKWVTNPTYGRQFQFNSCERSLPDTEGKLFRYLAGGAVKGIGAKTASKIIERFGEESADILENHPEKLALIKGISAKKAVDICADFKKNFAMRRLLIELENYGISPSECTEIYKFYGPNSVQMVKSNPYILCDAIQGFSFERSEALTRIFGISPDPRSRTAAGLMYIIRHTVYQGYTCTPLKKITDKAKEFLETDEQTIAECLTSLKESGKIIIDYLKDEEYIFTPEQYIAEINIAQKLKFILKFPPSYVKISDNDIEKLEKSNNIEYADKQKEAIVTAVEKGLLVLTGGPGTGKTTTVRGIIEYLEDKGVDVKLCAPTGRAAKRLSEVTDRDAKTIHRLLEVEYDDRDRPIFNRNKENPLRTGAVIIDEMSMVDTILCSALLDAIPIGCRIIIVGDSDQLPSVGAGNVLNDIIATGIVPVVCLTDIFRQAQQSLIVMNAHALMENRPMNLNSTDSDFFLLRKNNPMLAADLICDLVSRRLPAAYGYDSFNDIQVLCPSKMGECGTEKLNTRLQEALNPQAKNKRQINGPGGRVYREGDKVMQIKNNYSIVWDKNGEEGEGIFNGDIGIIESINVAGGFLKINFDDRITEYPFDNLNEIDFAYAVTIHKSQGSEYPAVIIPVIDCPPKLMYRNLLYTGLTRAKNLLILTGQEEKIIAMATDTRQKKRYSALRERLTTD